MGAMGIIVKHLKIDDAPEEYAEEYDGYEVSESCQEVSEDEESLSEDLDFLSEAYSGMSHRGAKVSEKTPVTDFKIPKQAEWQHRSLSKAALSREFDPFGIIVTLGIGGVAVVSTVYDAEVRVQIMLYVATIIMILVTNPLHAVEKKLALPSRWMIAISLGMVDTAINDPSKNIIIAATIVTVILMTFTIMGNNGWLIEETYLATEFTRKAQDLDVVDFPYLAWRAHGKREVWTAIEQAGLIVSEADVNLGYRIAYRIGHFHGMTTVEANNASKSRMQSRIYDLENYIDENESDFEETRRTREEIIMLKSNIDELRNSLKNAQDEAERNEAIAEELEKRSDEYKVMIADMNRQMREIGENGISAEGIEALIVKMLNAGISYRKIEAVTGQNKLVIGGIKNKYNIELPLKHEA